MKKTLLKLSLFALGALTSVGISAETILSVTQANDKNATEAIGGEVIDGVSYLQAKLAPSSPASTFIEDEITYEGAKLNNGSSSSGNNQTANSYLGMKFPAGTLQEGDIVDVIFTTTNSNTLFLIDDPVITNKTTYTPVAVKSADTDGNTAASIENGHNYLVLGVGAENLTGLFVARIQFGSYKEFNANIAKITVTREQTTPALKSFKLADVAGTIDQANGTVSIELPYGTSEPSDAKILAACTVNSAATEPTTYDAATHTITVTDGTTPKEYVLTITYAAAKTDATLKSLSYNGTAIELAEGTYSYDVELPYGTLAIPTVAYEINDETATAVPTQASALPGTATVVVTAQDGTTELTYTVNFTVKATASTDATLKSLKAGSITVALADGQYDYDVELPAGTTEAPALSYELNDETASAVVTDATSATGAASIVVTAQDGKTEHTYNVQFSIAAAPKTLLALPFDNGVKGYIYNATPSDPNYTAHTIYVPYIGTTTPTAEAATTKEGTTSAEVAANTVTLTSSVDGSSQEYALNFVQLTPVTIDDLTTPYTHTFDGSEIGSWIYSVYGYDASKGLKFAKTTNDTNNMRDAEGKTRIVFAIPAGVTHVELTSVGNKRNIKITVDGTTTNFDAADSYTFDLAGTEASLVMVESNQTGGDGGFSAITLSATSDPATGVEEAEAEVVNTNYISADGKTYNAAVKGLPLIKVEELSNGTIKTSKILVED